MATAGPLGPAVVVPVPSSGALKALDPCLRPFQPLYCARECRGTWRPTMKALPFVATLLFALCGCSVRYGVVGESYKSAAEISSRADDLSNVVVATVPRTKKPLEATALVVLPSRDRIVKDSYSQLAPIMQDAYSRCDERFFQSVYQMMEKRGIFATVTAAESASPETAPFDGRDFVIYYCATPAQEPRKRATQLRSPRFRVTSQGGWPAVSGTSSGVTGRPRGLCRHGPARPMTRLRRSRGWTASKKWREAAQRRPPMRPTGLRAMQRPFIPCVSRYSRETTAA